MFLGIEEIGTAVSDFCCEIHAKGEHIHPENIIDNWSKFLDQLEN